MACLQTVFGFQTFKPLQQEAIDSAIVGHDTLIILPTGGGKSLCFQIPALCEEGMTLVVSPLIALMNDQVLALQQTGVSAHAIHSHISDKEKYVIHEKLENGSLTLLYVSPEKLMSSSFLNYISGYHITRIAIDEAHCVSIWGNDFRPEYVKLGQLREHFPRAVFMALTATADRTTQEDIITQLQLKDAVQYVGSFERKNIYLEARPGTGRIAQIKQFIHERPGEPGIIYCLSRNGTENTASQLLMANIKADFYHAGMQSEQRNEVQAKFQNDEVQVICATIAFGMGIDKSNIRWIIHFNMPKNIEGYYQEIGRSGRDDLPAHALLFSSYGDYIKLQRFIDESQASDIFKEIQSTKLNRMWEFANTGDCRMNVILNYFDEYRSAGCQHCDNCENPPTKFDGTLEAQKTLSAVIRAKEQMGMTLTIDVLRGSGRHEIIQRQLHLIKTYGAGRDLSFLEWKSYLSQFINQGILRIDYTKQFSLKTTPLSAQILNGIHKVELVKFEKNTPKLRSRIKKQTKTSQFQQELMNELKDWRLKKAKQLNIPAYAIFHDASLEALASSSPALKSDLLQIHGFGDAKTDKYGDEILAIVRGYIETQSHLKNVRGQTYFETMKLYEVGHSIERIAEIRELGIPTIYGHIAKLYLKGEDVDIVPFITPAKIAQIKTAWLSSEHSTDHREVRKFLPQDFPYYEIQLGLAILLKEQNKDEMS